MHNKFTQVTQYNYHIIIPFPEENITYHFELKNLKVSNSPNEGAYFVMENTLKGTDFVNQLKNDTIKLTNYLLENFEF